MSDPWNPDSPDNCAVCGARLPRGMREVYDAAMAAHDHAELMAARVNFTTRDEWAGLVARKRVLEQALSDECRKAKEGR